MFPEIRNASHPKHLTQLSTLVRKIPRGFVAVLLAGYLEGYVQRALENFKARHLITIFRLLSCIDRHDYAAFVIAACHLEGFGRAVG